jgi:hypothetical protein
MGTAASRRRSQLPAAEIRLGRVVELTIDIVPAEYSDKVVARLVLSALRGNGLPHQWHQV